MDQLKEILRQAIKYRFWIAVGLSALLPMIAYLAGAGEIRKKADAEKNLIESADKDVKQYAAGTAINEQYKALTAEKTDDLTKDVDLSWKKLYERQAPLLTWPERVHDRFTAWGRKWPEPSVADPSAVTIAIIDYLNEYPGFVTKVYNSFKPFNYETGEGVVAAPPEEALLRPAKFSEQDPPGLGKVWAAQERLWIQRTLLDVISKVNKDAKGWDSAAVKQINMLEVGNTLAQDQRSIANGETLEAAPDIPNPSTPPPAEAPAPGPEGAPGGAMESAPGGAMPGSGINPTNDAEAVYYIKSDSTAFKVLPVELSVLIEQDHIADLLVALENSPMNIQVRDFEMSKPATRVTKPEKGVQMMSMYSGYEMGMPGNMPMGGGYRQMTGIGGPGMMDSMPGSYGPMGGAPVRSRTGVDKRSAQDRAKEAKEARERAKNNKSASLHDPYHNVVEVKIYGQARFFNPPPVAPAPEPSQAAAPAPTPDAATAPAAAPEATSAEAEKKVDEPKADAEKKADAAEKKADEPKDESPK